MKLGQIHKLAVELGVKNDLRGEAAAKAYLKKRKQEFDALPDKEKKYFDTELLINPYADSRIEYGDPDKAIKRVLAGIDMEEAEVLLADRLGNIDAIIAHHPIGRSLVELDEVMHMQAEILAKYGVPINIAEGIMRERISEVNRKIHPANQYQAISVARLLKIPYMVAHTVCDNMAANFIERAVQRAKPKTVGDILNTLGEIPEYEQAKRMGFGPILFAGAAKNSCGRIAVTEFTGGTDGSSLVYERAAHAGIGTIISMHLKEEARREAEKQHINIVVAGHISSDSLGMNLFFDRLEKNGVEIIPASGLIRVSRNKPGSKRKSRKK